MSSKNLAVSVRGVSKAYTIAHNIVRHTTLAEAMLHRFRHPFRQQTTETFWALKDVSFDIEQGDVVGIVGRNGAGKSTLLKILSRITEPTTGQIDLYGPVGSLLEVGTGFHPELTGRENIYLNGSILGMRRKEIDRQFDAIVDFAGVEKFLDTPVKRYSSGMYVRLAFAVAAHLNLDIMVVDEVLAVGDAEFQRKCLGKMKDVANSGRTVLFVSHNMGAVRQLCKSAILMRDGQLMKAGAVEPVVEEYLRQKSSYDYVGKVNSHGLELTDVAIMDAKNGFPTETLLFNEDYQLRLEVRAHQLQKHGGIVARIHDDLGILVTSLCAVEEGIGVMDYDGTHEVVFNIPKIQLLPGRYSMNVYMYKLFDHVTYMECNDALSFEVLAAPVMGASKFYNRGAGLVRIGAGGTARAIDGGSQRSNVSELQVVSK